MSDTAYGAPEDLAKAIRITPIGVTGVGGESFTDARHESVFMGDDARLRLSRDAASSSRLKLFARSDEGVAERPRPSVRDDTMTLRINFVPVIHTLIEPNLKLQLRAVKGYTDSYSDAKLELWYDPEIRPHSLTMPFPESLKALWVKHNASAPPTEVDFQSDKARMLTSFTLGLFEEANKLKLRLAYGEHGFLYHAGLLEKANLSGLEGQSYELIYASLKAAVDLPSWREWFRPHPSPAETKVALHLERRLAEQLATHSSLKLAPDADNDVLVAQREVRS